jgi:hypothetical protein
MTTFYPNKVSDNNGSFGYGFILEVNVNASFDMKNSTKQDGDSPKGSVDNTDGFQYGLTDATNVLKEKIIKRKVLFSQERTACRFPYPAYIGSHTCGSGCSCSLQLIYVGLELILLLCFLIKVCSVQQMMQPLSVLISNFHELLPSQPFPSSFAFAL